MLDVLTDTVDARQDGCLLLQLVCLRQLKGSHRRLLEARAKRLDTHVTDMPKAHRGPLRRRDGATSDAAARGTGRATWSAQIEVLNTVRQLHRRRSQRRNGLKRDSLRTSKMLHSQIWRRRGVHRLRDAGTSSGDRHRTTPCQISAGSKTDASFGELLRAK